jgi:small subunit ribosomal protein S20
MPNLKSAKKALRQSKSKNLHNQSYKDKIKNLIKKANKLLAEKKQKEAQELLPHIYKALDKAAKNGLIKNNNASRRKSRLTIRFSKAAA